jgi:hypothetical protein
MFDTNEVNLYKPDKIIYLSELKAAKQVYPIMRSMAARDYAYGLAYKPRDEMRYIYLKFGMSSPKSNRLNDNIMGERITRQIAHLSGWSKFAISSHGNDFVSGLSRLVEDGILSEHALNKNNIIMGIWNVHPLFRTCLVNATREEQALWLESYLAQQYKNDFKDNCPLLNHRDPSNNPILTKTWPAREIVQKKLFSF